MDSRANDNNHNSRQAFRGTARCAGAGDISGRIVPRRAVVSSPRAVEPTAWRRATSRGPRPSAMATLAGWTCA
eukprot:3120156-Pyramimonas_sp.AAC.1